MAVKLFSTLAAASMLYAAASALAVPVTDVPSGHWAAASVKTVTDRAIIDAPNGKFDGNRKVSRVELANVLARFAQSLEKSGWSPASASATKVKQPKDSKWATDDVTRYELAVVLDRVARNAVQGLPKPTGKIFGESVALPPTALNKIPKGSPAAASLTYLLKNKMLWGESPLLKPGDGTVSSKEATLAIAMTIAGLTDRLTDEPQNKPDLGDAPNHKHDK